MIDSAIAGFDDVAVVGEPADQQSRRHRQLRHETGYDLPQEWFQVSDLKLNV